MLVVLLVLLLLRWILTAARIRDAAVLPPAGARYLLHKAARHSLTINAVFIRKSSDFSCLVYPLHFSMFLTPCPVIPMLPISFLSIPNLVMTVSSFMFLPLLSK